MLRLNAFYLRLFFTLLIPFNFQAQEEQKNEWHLGLQVAQGVVVPEYQFVHAISNTSIQQVELSLYTQTYGTSPWQQLYNNPKFGLALSGSNLGNPSVLGNAFALYPFVAIPAVKNERFSWEHTIGLGVGYATKKFDLLDNYTNIAVGSHLNVHFSYRNSLNLNLTSRFTLNLGLQFSHFSNANLREPNLGINTLALSAKVNYRLNKKQTVIHHELETFNKAHEFAFVYAAGGKHTRALQEQIYFTSSLSVEYKRKAKRLFQYGGGLDLFYDSSTKIEMAAPGKEMYRNAYDFRSGIHVSGELIYNRFSFILQQGVYVGLTNHVDSHKLYNRALLRWKWNAHFLTHISMKSHLHILDYPELGFAYYF